MLFVTDGTLPPNIGGAVQSFLFQEIPQKNMKKIYTHCTYTVYNTNPPPPPFFAPPPKSFPHFVIVWVVLNQ